MITIYDEVKEILEKRKVKIIESNFNGEEGIWAIDDGGNEIIFKFNPYPDDETIKDFEDAIKNDN